MKFDISNFFNSFIDSVGNWLDDTLSALFSILPDSPFAALSKVDGVDEILGIINFFIPINYMISVLQLWLIAVAGYYIWQLALRWAKAIE